MDITKKTSTHSLVDKKTVKKIKTDKRYTFMDEVLGLEGFEYIETASGPVPCIISSRDSHSMVLKISTADSGLLDVDETENFENTLMSFIYGLNGELKFEATNRKQDFKKYIEFIESCEDKRSDNENLKKYLNCLYAELRRLESQVSGTVQSNYIIVYSRNPHPKVSIKETIDRAEYVMGALNDNNFKVAPIAGLELYEYLFAKTHRNSGVDVENFINKDSFKLISDTIFGNITYEDITFDDVKRHAEAMEKEKIEKELEKTNNMSKKELEKYKKTLKKNKAKKANVLDEDNVKNISLIDILKPDVFLEKEDYLRLGTTTYCRMLSVETLPSSMNILTLNSLLDNDMEISIHLKKRNEAFLRKNLKSQYGKVVSNIQYKEKTTGQVDYGEIELAKNIDGLIKSVETNSDKVFYAQIVVKLFADDLVGLEEVTKKNVDEFSKLGLNLRVLFFDQKNAYMNTLPTASIKFDGNRRNITTGGASCLVPTGCSHLRQREGRYVGRTLGTNSPIILDPFICQKPQYAESNLYNNPNVYIVGVPGSGKSVFIKTQIEKAMYLGDINVTIDPHNEYYQLCKALGGNYIYLQAGKKTGINPLQVNIVIDEETGKKVVPINEKVGEITALINSFIYTYRDKRALVGVEITGVSEAIRTAYERKGITENPESLYCLEDGIKVRKQLPILTDIKTILYEKAESMKQLGEIANMMEIITGEGMMAIFDCQTDVKIERLFKDKLLCFSLKNLDQLTRTFALSTLLNWLWGVFSDWSLANVQKTIYMDEAWEMAKNKAAMSLIENFVRSGRKYLISMAFGSQSINEFMNSQEGQVILTFCSTKYIFKQEAYLAKEIGKFFGLPKEAQNKLPSFEKGQCILSTALTNVVAQVDLFDYEIPFATTSKKIRED